MLNWLLFYAIFIRPKTINVRINKFSNGVSPMQIRAEKGIDFKNICATIFLVEIMNVKNFLNSIFYWLVCLKLGKEFNFHLLTVTIQGSHNSNNKTGAIKPIGFSTNQLMI